MLSKHRLQKLTMAAKNPLGKPHRITYLEEPLSQSTSTKRGHSPREGKTEALGGERIMSTAAGVIGHFSPKAKRGLCSEAVPKIHFLAGMGVPRATPGVPKRLENGILVPQNGLERDRGRRWATHFGTASQRSYSPTATYGPVCPVWSPDTDGYVR